MHAGAAADRDDARACCAPGRRGAWPAARCRASARCVRARTTPNSPSTASITASLPAIEAVCDCAAALPIALRPTFIITTGLRARRAASSAATRPVGLADALGVQRDHVGVGVVDHHLHAWPIVMSDSLPVITSADSPTACRAPRLKQVAAVGARLADDADAARDRHAGLDARAEAAEEAVARVDQAERVGPEQPHAVRARRGQHALLRHGPRLRPSSAKPALKTIAAPCRGRPARPPPAGVAAAGTATIATSGASGRAATDGKAGRPCTCARFGFTGRMRPA